MSLTAPSYLTNSSKPLANQTFADIKSEAEIQEVFKYLSLKHALLDRVIRARKLHHSHFFSQNMDYGHQNYLDNLQSQKFITLRALERLERRTAEVLYLQQKWFKWVREQQDQEEEHRDNESKRIKREAALFRRHSKEIQLRMKLHRDREEKLRQEEYLDKAYNERISQENQWDPIEDVVENDRGNYVDLIRHFLWEIDLPAPDTKLSEDGVTEPQTSDSQIPVKRSKGPKTKGKAKARDAKTSEEPSRATETREEMRRRLKEGSEFKHEYGPEAQLGKGSIEDPTVLEKSPPLPDDEIEPMLGEISEIKQLLFCRLLLSHAALFPAGHRAETVEAFLNDSEISTTDLRDLCLKMENPDLQDIRDACADMVRSEEEPDNIGTAGGVKAAETSQRTGLMPSLYEKNKKDLPKSWQTRHEKQLSKRKKIQRELGEEEGGSFIDFGVIDDEGMFKRTKIQVKVCGRLIWNYRSERALTHAGWFHFSIIAKDSNLYDAIRLCRHWDEFFELNILAICKFFPAANWLMWAGDRLRTQYLLLVSFPQVVKCE